MEDKKPLCEGLWRIKKTLCEGLWRIKTLCEGFSPPTAGTRTRQQTLTGRLCDPLEAHLSCVVMETDPDTLVAPWQTVEGCHDEMIRVFVPNLHQFTTILRDKHGSLSLYNAQDNGAPFPNSLAR